ncbi:Tetraacyldisaccharide 4'-kinase [Nymphon striatum]|nr:Tetraacyldisaccharide 4'-kinase [Nymphon striatum]
MNNTSWLQQWLENVWYKGGKGKYLLLPLTGLYCAVNGFQRWKAIRNLKNKPKLPCPVIVVGNITVGGTGKTPLTVYLVKLLQKAGYKPAIITRGYGGQATSWPQSVTHESDAQQVGDEAVLMASRTQVTVFAGADRMESIEQLLKNHDCDVIISDDGMQHYKMPRDMQIAVIDGTRLLGNGLCLPAGPLREKKEKLDECDFVVVNSVNDTQELNSRWIRMELEGGSLTNINSDLSRDLTKAISDFNGVQVHAVTGIGNPQRFYKTLEQTGLKLITHSFPDHHDFKADDIKFNDELPIVMTEKDAVKCRQFAGDNVWYLPVSARLSENFDEQFLTVLKRKRI